MKRFIHNNRGFLVFLFLFGLFRTAIADWNPIPTGSMRPNILEGDVVLINRLAYDVKVPLTDIIVAHIAEPQRGDIVTFTSPTEGTRMIKRLVGLPGDRIEMRDKKLIINGKPQPYSFMGSVTEYSSHHGSLEALQLIEGTGSHHHIIQWLNGVRSRDDFGPIIVPDRHFLMLGDNRDSSADSRYFGLVPRHRLIGKANHILVSSDFKKDWSLRIDRFGQPLK